MRTSLGLASLGLAFVSSIALIPPTPVRAATQAMDLAVDQQAYVPDNGPDAYESDALSQGNTNGPDPIDIHVAAAPSQSTYHSFVHIEVESVSASNPGATVSSLTLTLYPTTDPTKSGQDNVNASAAILDAFPLKTPMAPNFNGCPAPPASCSYPAYDSTFTPVVGQVHTDGTSCPAEQGTSTISCWTFDLGPMLDYWQSHGNTGAAIVGNASATTQPWAIGFDRTLSGASAQVNAPAATPPPVTTTTHPVTPPHVNSGTSVVAPVTVPTPSATTPPRRTPSPTHAPIPAATSSVPTNGGAGQVPIWMLVLVASLVAAVALLAQPVSAALSGTGGLRIGIAHELQLHPRIAAVAALLVVWSSAWGVYSGVTGAGRLNNNLASIGAPGSSVPGYSPDNGSTSTAAPGTSGSASGGASVSGGGGGGTINGAPVGAAAFQGANTPAVPSANYYSGQDNTVGITNTTIQMCAHAALTFGPAFNIGPGDLNVFWQMVDDPSLDPYAHTSGQAGIYNRQIVEPGGSPGIPIQDDGYQPSKAVQAATACQQQSGGDFFLLSGIGFDQIPAVRNWAEQNHMLYIHHIATAQGTGGLQFSFTMLPTLEQVGTQFGQYYTHHMNGQKIAIIERNSSNWAPGVRTFKSVLAAAGESGNITTDDSVTNNQGDYSKEIADFCVQHQSQAVFIWENALAADQIIQQTNQQTGGQCKPNWLLFPFNLTLQTLNQSGVDTSTMQGMVPWPAYTCASQRPSNYFAGNSAYQQEVAQFEAMYAKFDSGANLCGFGGDLLFGTWEAWKQVADLLVQCGPSCTRNNIAGLMLSGYKATVGSNCPVDFSAGDHHHGGTGEDLYLTEPGGNGRIWYNTGFCEVNVT